MIGILGGMGTQAGLDFCNKLAILYRGKIDQEYPLFLLYNKSNIPGRPESIGIQTGNISNTIPTKTRYILGVQNSIQSLLSAKSIDLKVNSELMVEELRLAIQEIGKITGHVDVEEYLEVIFKDFCIGK